MGKSLKILINRKPVVGPWGGGNLFVKAFCEVLKNQGANVVHNIQNDIDIIFMQDPRPGDTGISINEILLYKESNPRTKIIHRVNECDSRKGTNGLDDLLQKCSAHTDFTVFVSGWMRDYHISRGWFCKNSEVIYNGVNLDHFKSREKLNNGKINIVTHHWSNNRMKGFDVYEAIDRFVEDNQEFTFTYIGRELGTFKSTSIIEPKFGIELGKELSKYDVYISGSLFDPGPNHILESLACEIPTYVLDKGGGAVEFAGESHSVSSVANIIELLKNKSFSKNTSIAPYSWNSCISRYRKVFTEITQ